MDTDTKPATPEVDDELNAMQAIIDSLAPLADFEQARVLRWAADRYGVTLGDDHD